MAGSSPTSTRASPIIFAALLIGFAEAMDAEPLADDLADGQSRAEAAEGVLEDDLHLAAERAQRLPPQALDVVPGKADDAVR